MLVHIKGPCIYALNVLSETIYTCILGFAVERSGLGCGPVVSALLDQTGGNHSSDSAELIIF